MSLISNLQQRGLWTTFERHVVGLEPILQAMSERGMPVNPEKFAEVKALLERDIAAAAEKIESLVPDAIRKVKTYKKTPKKVTAAHFEVDGHWFKREPWKPSHQGLIAYMNFRKHPVPRAIKGDKDTTNALELKRLYRSTKDPMYGAVLEYRKAQTILSNHMENWKPGPDGRCHPTFYYTPATAQLSSARPNVQNAPTHDDEELGIGYASEFRGMIKPRPEHMLVECDYHGFHVMTLAFNARDLDMLRIGRIDIHSFVTAHFKRLANADALFGMKDDELREYLKWVKKEYKHVRNAQVKHALLGYNNGMGYNKLYKQYMEFFNSSTEAKQVLKLLDSLFPKAKEYRDAICQKAHDQGYLISRHGYIRYFWEVNRWQGGEWSHGDDHEAALCFYTQNDAHGELRDRMVEIHKRGLDSRYNMLNTIHDSLIFEPHETLVDECCGTIKDIMQSPSRVLIDPVVAPHGLSIDVDVKVGPDWAHLKEL